MNLHPYEVLLALHIDNTNGVLECFMNVRMQ